MQTPILKVNNISAGYIKGVDILNGLNFQIYSDEIVTVIGPNGAGKSTFAKAIAGLLKPHTGEILFKNEPIHKLAADRVVAAGICYVPQISNVFRTLTIEENLDMGGFISKEDLRPAKREIFEIFPRLSERRKQRAGTLSGGERQMLAMGKALMLKPRLLVLDEPSAALSPKLVGEVFDRIRQIRDSGCAIVLVEQNAKQALAMSDRGYVLDGGKDAVVGTGEELLGDPKVAQLYLGVKH
jgi:neutral amino acid transport system ATP-binding protein